jgi:hypothetical protein
MGAVMGWISKMLPQSRQEVNPEVECRKPFSITLLGMLDMIVHAWTGARMVSYVISGGFEDQLLPHMVWTLLSITLLTAIHGAWLFFLPPHKYRASQFGRVTTIVEVVRVLGLCCHIFMGRGFLDFAKAMHSRITPSCGHPVVLMYVLVVRTALLQLPCPWLLLHAAVQWVLVLLLCYATPEICGENWVQVPLWLQGVVFMAVGVGIVLVVRSRQRGRDEASKHGSGGHSEKERG